MREEGAFRFARSKPRWIKIPEGLEVHESAPYHPSVTGAGAESG